MSSWKEYEKAIKGRETWVWFDPCYLLFEVSVGDFGLAKADLSGHQK